MTPRIPLVYLDSCVIIAFLKREDRSPEEMNGYRYCFEQLERKETKAITSSMTRTEILDSHFPSGTYDRFKESFSKRRSLQFIDADIRVSSKAQVLRTQYGLESMDATHLATAILYTANVLYTYDQNHLLPLNGIIPDTTLCICRPPAPSQLYLPQM